MARSIAILSPHQLQARAIARWLRRNGFDGTLIGVPDPGRASVDTRLYDRGCALAEVPDDADVVPTGFSSTESHVLAHRAEGGIRVGSVRFSVESLRVAEKPWMLAEAERLGVPVPKTWARFEEVPTDGGPLFFKPADERSGLPRRRVAHRDAIPSEFRVDGMLYQELITGAGVHAVGFIAEQGRILASCQHHELASQPVDGGSAIAVRAVTDARLGELAAKLVAGIGYSGWGLAEFKRCPRRDDFVLMEINPKFWASVEFALRSEPAFGRLLFGIEAVAEKLPGLVFPARFLRAIRGNAIAGTRALAALPWSWEREWPSLSSIAAGLLPTSMVDRARAARGGRS